MKLFSGFPSGKVEVTPLPNLFFSELCPAINDLAELKVTLHIFWLVANRKARAPQYVTANELRAGTVWINDHGVFATEMPHGGVKQSGFGKDSSLYAMEEYTNIKHVYIDTSGAARKPWHGNVLAKK